MRRIFKIAVLSLTIGFTTLDAQAQPPVPPVPVPPAVPAVPAVPSPGRVVRDVDGTVRRATPVRRRVRRHGVRKSKRARRVVHRRANAVTLRPPVKGLPTLWLPKPPIPR